jgi:hypothetical protein
MKRRLITFGAAAGLLLLLGVSAIACDTGTDGVDDSTNPDAPVTCTCDDNNQLSISGTCSCTVDFEDHACSYFEASFEDDTTQYEEGNHPGADVCAGCDITYTCP